MKRTNRPVVYLLALAALVGALVLWWMTPSMSESDDRPRANPAAAAPPASPLGEEKPRPREAVPRRRAAEPDAAADADEQRTGGLTVRVVAAETGRPVARATVVAEDDRVVAHTSTTGDDGVARFDPPVEGGYARIDATAAGFAKGHEFADADSVRTGAEVKVELAAAAEYAGKVVDDATGAGVAGARVTALAIETGRSPRDCDATVSAADGTFRLTAVPAGRPVALRVAEPHHVTLESRVDLRGEQPNVIRLEPAGVLRGIVTGAGGAPAAGASVIATSSFKASSDSYTVRHVAEASSDASGAYAIEGLSTRGEWRVVASARGACAAEPATVVFDADSRDAVRDFTLRPLAYVDVQAKLPDGSPAAGAEVHLSDDAKRSVFTRTGADGTCTLEVAYPGTAQISVTASPLPEVRRSVDVQAGERVAVEVRVETGAVVSGIVVDDLGNPVSDANIEIQPTDRFEAVTGADGAFRFEGLAPGPYRLNAEVHQRVFGPGKADVTAPADGVRIVMRRTGRVSFRVSASAGTPPDTFTAAVVGKPVTIEAQEFPWTTKAVTLTVAAQPATLIVGAKGCLQAVRKFDVAPGADTDLGEIVLDRGRSLAGRVVDAAGKPVPGAAVQLGADLIQANEVGEFLFEALPDRDLELVVRAKEFVVAEQTVDPVSVTSPLVVTLHRGASVHGIVRDMAGALVTDATVVLTPEPTEQPFHLLRLDEKGSYTGKVLPGRWRIEVRRLGDSLVTRVVTLAESSDTTLDLVLER